MRDSDCGVLCTYRLPGDVGETGGMLCIRFMVCVPSAVLPYSSVAFLIT